jgi:branched-chain amino acid transport system substrate-binding protein
MTLRLRILRHTLAIASLTLAAGAMAQGTIKIGEINSYKAQPAFLEPYKRRAGQEAGSRQPRR